jgi:hypothetical protein
VYKGKNEINVKARMIINVKASKLILRKMVKNKNIGNNYQNIDRIIY